jgi:subtilase family serine protease
MKTSVYNVAIFVLSVILTACGGGNIGTVAQDTQQSSETVMVASIDEAMATTNSHTKSIEEVDYQDVRYLLGTGIGATLSPKDVRAHYSFPDSATGKGQTIAIIAAPSSSDVMADLAKFSKYYNLPVCDKVNVCFKQIDLSNGAKPVAGSYSDWRGEVALDTQWAHAVAPEATILLVTAKVGNMGSLLEAVKTASQQPGVVAISMSFGMLENVGVLMTPYDGLLKSIQQKGITLIASSGDIGDNGGPNEWPAVSPYVTAVGGTTIKTVGYSLPTVATEVAWKLGGGGASTTEAIPDYQDKFISTNIKTINPGKKRLIPDVSYSADPLSSPVGTIVNGVWNVSGGTSAGAPQWAGILAIIAQDRAVKGKTTLVNLVAGTPGGFNGLIYSTKVSTTGIFDVTTGTNVAGTKTCALCNASIGYDAVTGLGVPNVTNLLNNI